MNFLASRKLFNCGSSLSHLKKIPNIKLARYSLSNSFQKKNIIPIRHFSETLDSEIQSKEETPLNPSIQINEKIIGQPIKQTFKAETKRLLEIVANSLYSEKEVFVRELVSNASDACEKLRYFQLTKPESLDSNPNPLEININVDKEKKLFVIQDFGIGMDKKDLEENLGTIALSGASKFMEMIKSDNSSNSSKSNIIGQFGVGFYSAFTVGHHVQVFSRSALKGSKGYCWSSDGLGEFSLSEAENVDIGTKIVIHLKEDELQYADLKRIEHVIKKYSNFVGFPVKLNGSQKNTVLPLWMMEKSQINEDQYTEFYKFIADSFEGPQFRLHYSTDAPVQLRALLFVPKSLPLFAFQKEDEPKISLYSRKVLIKQKTDELLPPWLGFVRGVVDSEDIPLNLSRELLQNNLLIQKIKRVLTSRIVKWLQEEQNKSPDAFATFYKKIAPYLKGGVLQDFDHKREITSLLMFESSSLESGKLTNLKDYISRAQSDQNTIYLCLANSREAALNSPYYEPFKKRGIEVLLSFDKMDEFLVGALDEYEGKKIIRIEDAKLEPLKTDNDTSSLSESPAKISPSEIDGLCSFITGLLKTKVKTVKTASRDFSPPLLIVDHAMHSLTMKHFRHMMSVQGGDLDMPTPPVDVEINPNHPIIQGLLKLKESQPELADEIVLQIFDNALVDAGLLEQSHAMVRRINSILTNLVSKYN